MFAVGVWVEQEALGACRVPGTEDVGEARRWLCTPPPHLCLISRCAPPVPHPLSSEQRCAISWGHRPGDPLARGPWGATGTPTELIHP